MQKHKHTSNSKTKEPISSSRSAGRGQSSLHTETCRTKVQRQRGPVGGRGWRSWMQRGPRQEHRKGAQGMGAQPHFVREGNPGLLLKTHGGTTPADNSRFCRITEPFGLERPSGITECHCASSTVKASTDPCPHVTHPHGF